MTAKPIVTPVLKYWGFDRHPFDDFVLRGEELALFIDRDTEIRRLQNALSNPLCGAFGTQGVGKSSVLNRLSRQIEQDGYAVVGVQMTGTSENVLYREILASILREIKEGHIKTLSKFKLHVDRELERVEHSIKYTSSMEASGEAGLKVVANLGSKVGVKKSEERELLQHTEDTAMALISQIALHIKEPFVVIIDNLERTKSLLDHEEAYFRFVTRFARTIDTAFSETGIAFVVSLDQSFANRIKGQLPGTEEAYSFSFGQLVEIGAFPPADLFAVLARRLSKRGWPGKTDDFIAREAFWALALATGGHPRRAFAVLREAMELIAASRAKKQIALEHLRQAATNCREKIDETDMKIIEFLATHKPHSSSDEPFTEAVGITRPRLGLRLAELQKIGILCMTQEISGTAKKDTYSLQDLS
ncbi:MAG: ATP-binding protein [Candidatus Sumerlaeota bacterium]|nr:ATP-binding protein [Candidatus Sumerlaeota bacterium]